MNWRRVLVAATVLAGCTLAVAGCGSDSVADIVPTEYEVEEGVLFPVEVGGRYGFIDRTGEMVIQPQFAGVRGFNEGLASALSDGRWGYIDTTGAWVIEPQFLLAYHFSEGLALAMPEPGSGWGYIDKGGAFVIEPQFRRAESFSGGLAMVNTDQGSGYIDQTGTWVIQPRLAGAESFSEGLAAMALPEDALGELAIYGYIDTSGEWVLEPRFYAAYSFSEGLACVGWLVDDETRWGFIDKTGVLMIELELPTVDSASGMRPITFSEGLAPWVGDQGTWGYIDKTGTFVIQPQFWAATAFYHGLAWVWLQDDSTEAYIDRTGKVIWSRE